MTPTQERALALLDKRVPQRTGTVGLALWPDSYRQPQSLARPAGKALRALERLGLAYFAVSGDDYGWVRT